MEYYGTDKPDIRYELKINDITGIFSKSGLKIFNKVIDSGGFIKCIVVPEYNKLVRKDLDGLVDVAKSSGADGLVWIKINDDGSMQSPIAKFLSDNEKKALIDTLNLKKNNIVLLVAGNFKTTCGVLGDLRVYLAKKMGLAKKGDYEIVWVYDFPLFEWDEKEKSLSPVHHPFTSPDRKSLEILEDEPLKARSLAYDIIINGQEIGGGSIRINNALTQQKIFKLLNIDKKTIKENFGFLIEALSYGAPPHGGIALGMDRLAMILSELDTIRDVIAFPKTQSGMGLLTGSPSDVKKEQLDEVFIKTISAEED
jgi:aspartyl-tRNA synthetase